MPELPSSQTGVGARVKGRFRWYRTDQFLNSLRFLQIGSCCSNTFLPLLSIIRLSALMFPSIYFFPCNLNVSHNA